MKCEANTVAGRRCRRSALHIAADGQTEVCAQHRERVAVAPRASRAPQGGYPAGWPACPGCGRPALDGHITCGDVSCDEGGRR